MTTLKISKPLFIGLLNEGGSMMYLILIALLLSLFFIIQAFIKRKSDLGKSKKMLGLAVDSSLLSLVLGCFGSVLGLIQLFDVVQTLGNVKPDIFASGLKVSLLTIVFGLFAFVIGRVGILIFRWTDKEAALD